MGEMPSTRSYHVTIQERAVREVGFRRALLAGAVECFLNGEMGVGKTLMRDVINATVGYTKLGELTQRHPKSLMRMFSPAGNPQARNLFEVILRLREHEDIRFEVTAVLGADEPQSRRMRRRPRSRRARTSVRRAPPSGSRRTPPPYATFAVISYSFHLPLDPLTNMVSTRRLYGGSAAVARGH